MTLQSPQPLAGLRVMVTRAPQQSATLVAQLSALGAEVLCLPLIEIVGPSDPAPLQQAVARLSSFDWLVFTSTNAVSALLDRLPSASRYSGKTAAVGATTAASLQSRGFSVDLVPERHTAEDLLEAFSHCAISGSRILLPTAAVRREILAAGLRRLGADVTVVEAYRNRIPEASRSQAPRAFENPPDWILLASPSAVDHLVELVGRDRVASVRIAVIGPVTAGAAARHGLRIAVEAKEFTSEGLVRALAGGTSAEVPASMEKQSPG